MTTTLEFILAGISRIALMQEIESGKKRGK